MPRQQYGRSAYAAAYVLVSNLDPFKYQASWCPSLRGDPQVFAALAKSSEHKYCYTSAVVAWHLDDAPTDEDINEVLNEFEATCILQAWKHSNIT